MTGPQALAMAVSGGFFGTLLALTIFFVFLRIIVAQAVAKWLRGPHERNECPVCKRPMLHEEAPS